MFLQVNDRSALSVKGSIYKIIGPIQHTKNMPIWFEEKFVNGFPPLWKTYVDDYLEWLGQQSSGDDSDDNILGKSTGLLVQILTNLLL